jgi:hypothetical protein
MFSLNWAIFRTKPMVVSVRSPIRRLHAQFIDTKRLKALVLILGGPGKFRVINKRIKISV